MRMPPIPRPPVGGGLVMSTITCSICGRSESLSRVVWEGDEIRCKCGHRFSRQAHLESTPACPREAATADPVAPVVPADGALTGTRSAVPPDGGAVDLGSVIVGTVASSTTFQT